MSALTLNQGLLTLRQLNTFKHNLILIINQEIHNRLLYLQIRDETIRKFRVILIQNLFKPLLKTHNILELEVPQRDTGPLSHLQIREHIVVSQFYSFLIKAPPTLSCSFKNNESKGTAYFPKPRELCFKSCQISLWPGGSVG